MQVTTLSITLFLASHSNLSNAGFNSLRASKKLGGTEEEKNPKVIWKERSIHPGAPTHTTPVLCEKKAIAPLQ